MQVQNENIQVKAVKQTAAVRAAYGKHASRTAALSGEGPVLELRETPAPLGGTGSRRLPGAGLTGAGGRRTRGWLPHHDKEGGHSSQVCGVPTQGGVCF